MQTYRIRAHRTLQGEHLTCERGDMTARDAASLHDTLVAEGWTVYLREESIRFRSELDAVIAQESSGTES